MTARPFAVVPAVLVAAASVAPAAEPKVGEWVALFNGKNLDGWSPKIKGYDLGENFGDTFRVEDGVIKVAYDKYDGKFRNRFGHLFYKDKFSHYILRVEYRFVGDQCGGAPGWALRNSGIMFHCQSPQSMRKDQDFPVSVEAQFLGGTGKGDRPTMSVCSPGTHIVMDGKLVTRHCTTSKSRTFPGDVWVTAEIEVRGSGKVIHRVNGEVVLEYEQCQLDDKDADGGRLLKERNGKVLIEEGWIALQAESHPCEFRKVEIRLLEK
jgi:hypothetical protein